jgi:hypothetical protein
MTSPYKKTPPPFLSPIFFLSSLGKLGVFLFFLRTTLLISFHFFFPSSKVMSKAKGKLPAPQPGPLATLFFFCFVVGPLMYYDLGFFLVLFYCSLTPLALCLEWATQLAESHHWLCPLTNALRVGWPTDYPWYCRDLVWIVFTYAWNWALAIWNIYIFCSDLYDWEHKVSWFDCWLAPAKNETGAERNTLRVLPASPPPHYYCQIRGAVMVATERELEEGGYPEDSPPPLLLTPLVLEDPQYNGSPPSPNFYQHA